MAEMSITSAPAELRTLLADDNLLFRRGLRALLQGAGMDVVGEAADGRSAVRLAFELCPDVVLMDTEMPVLDGIAATALIADAPDPPAVVVLAGARTPAAVDAILAGARCMLLKTAEPAEIVEATRLAAAGQSSLSPVVAGLVVTRMCELERAARARDVAIGERNLTARESDVLRLLAAGRDNAAIGEELFISPSTVKHHVAAILDKLGVQNRVQAAVAAVRIGLA